MTQELTVNDRAAAARLDVFLATGLGVARSRAQRLLRDHAVTVNGQSARASYVVQAGDRITVTQAEAPSAQKVPSAIPVVYEDADILVIDKPAGLAAHAGAGLAAAEPTVADFARQHSSDPDPDRPGIVHRLDRDTSGLMIIAKTIAAKAAMQQQFRDRAVHKTYTLLVVGRVKPAEAVIRLPLDRDPANPLRRAVVSGGREAITRYRTRANYAGYSLLEAAPETGRTHQLRVHLAAIGHPIAGDRLYGSARAALGLKRQFLHASQLEFTTPSGQPLSLHSPLPDDLTHALQSLEGNL